MRTFIFTLALLAANSAIAADTADQSPVKQLAAHPLALVKGDRCEIRGAVWAYGPRAGVNVEILDGKSIHKARTNDAGVYALSIPFDGTDIALMERISDPIRVRDDLVDKTKVTSPVFVCSTKLTTQILSQTKRSK